MSTYNQYIQSKLWLSRHQRWLQRTHRRCQLFPWLRVGKVGGKHHTYSIHHMHRSAYERLGYEAWHRDVLVLSRFAHECIFHWLLSGGKRRVHHQKSFPNALQRLVNWWCRLVGVLLWLPPLVSGAALSCLLLLLIARVG